VAVAVGVLLAVNVREAVKVRVAVAVAVGVLLAVRKSAASLHAGGAKRHIGSAEFGARTHRPEFAVFAQISPKDDLWPHHGR
jgi:hypothetical protein